MANKTWSGGSDPDAPLPTSEMNPTGIRCMEMGELGKRRLEGWAIISGETAMQADDGCLCQRRAWQEIVPQFTTASILGVIDLHLVDWISLLGSKCLI